MVVKIVPNDRANPPGKLADAELHFNDGVLDGLKLIGFSVWERRTGNGRNVTFPARQYSVNGERRSFALLRPVADAASQERVRDLVLEAYATFEQEQTEAASERLTQSRTLPSGSVRELQRTKNKNAAEEEHHGPRRSSGRCRIGSVVH